MGDDAARLLPAMLQRVQPQRHEIGVGIATPAPGRKTPNPRRRRASSRRAASTAESTSTTATIASMTLNPSIRTVLGCVGQRPGHRGKIAEPTKGKVTRGRGRAPLGQ
jgi:hypothetical protein